MSETTATTPRWDRPKPGDQLDLEVDSLAHGGAGVARRPDGYVVFVQGGMPGDKLRARITKSKRGYAEARAIDIVEPGAARIEPRAFHPGAPWQVLPYERQLAEKEAQVRDALERIGGFEDAPVLPIVPALEQWRYRNKLEYSFGTSEEGELVLGFHRPGSWEIIDDVSEDILASERIDALRGAVKQWAIERGYDAYDRRTNAGFLRNLVVREGRRTGQLQARLVTSPGEIDVDTLRETVDADGLLWTTQETVGETTRVGKTKLLEGKKYIEEELAGLRFRISPEAFFQTNTEMAEKLYEIAVEAAQLTAREKVFDLYCGSGTIAIAMSGFADEVWGVEVVESAIADAIKNAKINGVDNAKFFAGDIRTAARPLVEAAGKPDVIVVDPPRAGLSQKIVRRIIEMESPRIVYVSCNPTTLAPNARQLVEAGYELKSVQPVDMFPQTPHIESVALLEKKPA